MNITQLELWTNDLTEQRRFYADRLGLPIVTSTATRLELQVGATRLIWTQAPEGWRGYYHFALTIPNNQFAAAKAWLERRVALRRDAEGSDEFHSDNWNSDSLYFDDPAGNISELIARHTLDNAATAAFGAQSLLEISEIGVASNDVPATVAQLRAQCDIAVYHDASDTFAPVGDAHGLFIVVKQGRIWFPDTGKAAVVAPMTANIQNGHGQTYIVTVAETKIAIG